MKQSNNQVKGDETNELMATVQKLHLQRDILALTLEIQQLKEVLYGDPSTEEAES